MKLEFQGIFAKLSALSYTDMGCQKICNVKNIQKFRALSIKLYNEKNLNRLNNMNLQRRIQNPFKHLRWGVLRKYLTVLGFI